MYIAVFSPGIFLRIWVNSRTTSCHTSCFLLHCHVLNSDLIYRASVIRVRVIKPVSLRLRLHEGKRFYL